MDAFDRFKLQLPTFKINPNTLHDAKVKDRLTFLLKDAEDLIVEGHLRHSWEYYDEHQHYLEINPHLDLSKCFTPAYQAYNRWISEKTRRQRWQRANPGVDRRLFEMAERSRLGMK